MVSKQYKGNKLYFDFYVKACLNGHVEIVRQLVKHGAEINCKTIREGFTALMFGQYLN